MTRKEYRYVWRPNLEFENVMQYSSPKQYGGEAYDSTKTFELWYLGDQQLEYSEPVQLNLLCQFSFIEFPFDSHECNVEYWYDGYGVEKLRLTPATISYRNSSIQFGNDPILINHLPLPFEFQLVPLSATEKFYDKPYSYTGLVIRLKRNSFGKLLSGFYYPTASFALLSMISYLINPDVVRFSNSLNNMFLGTPASSAWAPLIL